MTAPAEKLEENLKDEISKSGFPLEIKSALTLEKLGWNTIPHVIYFNESRQCNNEIDLTAFKQIKNTDLGLAFNELIVECKKQQKKPWVFFEGGRPNMKVTTILAQPRETIYRWVDEHFEDHYYRRQKPCKFHFPCFVKSGVPDVILDAINQVIDATIFSYGQKMGGNIPWFFYPTIILDGRLFSATAKLDGSIALTETNYLQLWANRALIRPETIPISESKGIGSYTRDFIIDIVRFDFLEEFLKNFA